MDEMTSIRVPTWFRDALKVEAAKDKLTMGEFVVKLVVSFYPDVERAKNEAAAK